MSLWKIALRSLRQRSLSTLLTGLSLALGVALVVAVLVIHGAVTRSFNRTAQGYHLIVGPKGGRLELVLNTVFHLGTPMEPIPWTHYKEFTEEDGKYRLWVDVAIPFCLGDNYQGHRVVGTNAQLLETLEYGKGDRYTFAGGRNLRDDGPWEAVIGSMVASKTGLRLGSKFAPTHGVSSTAEENLHKEQFEVVGILDPTGTSNDRAVFVNFEGFYRMEGHAKPVEKEEGAAEDGESAAGGKAPHPEHEHEGDAHAFVPLPENQREVSAILVRCKYDALAGTLTEDINEDNWGQAVSPVKEVHQLMHGIVGNLKVLLLVLAWLVVVVAAIGITVAMYNSMQGRRHEIAVIRALGAGRGTVMAIVLLESAILSLGGGLAGVVLGHVMLGAVSPLVVQYTGVSIGFFQFDLQNEPFLVPLLVVLAALAGYLPALAAYRTDVAKGLSAAP